MKNMYRKVIIAAIAVVSIASIAEAKTLSIVAVTQQDTIKSRVKNNTHVVTSNKNGNKGNYIYINNGTHEEIKYNGDINLTEDFKDVKSISANGYLRYLKKGNGVNKKLEIQSDKNGKLTRKYYEGGKEVAYEPAGKKWLQLEMPTIIAKTGIGLEAMVQDIYKKGGAKAVLAEADKIDGGSSKLKIVSYLMAQPNLSAPDTKLALQHAAVASNSDYELGKLLKKVPAARLAKDDLAIAYLQAAQKISSDYEKGKVLSHFLATPHLSKNTAAAAVKTVNSISSDYEKSKIIQKMANQESFLTDNYKLTFGAINSISSDYEKSKSISSILNKQKLSEAQYQALFPVVSSISSDYEKSKVLRNMASRLPANATALREDYKKTAKTISSDYEYRKAIEALN
ncbi:hypothetical protein [uncultured Pontibacter sp.]|uniref:hypothetical protein n=1 Tax=uncultured Pontibacter sp. TaxID=453356 RepID=UPI00261BC450|nr:hypothetical protein [uncultured Pontibacter sp.]